MANHHIETKVPALLRRLAEEKDKLVQELPPHVLRMFLDEILKENERMRWALREITEVRYEMVGQRSNATIAMAYVRAFSQCQGIARRVLHAEKGGE